MSRVTKQIRLVLLSSSLVLPGCEQRPHWSQSVGTPNSNMPTACGPVDGRTAGQPGIRAEDDGCYVDGNVPQGGIVDNRTRTHVGYVSPIGYIGSRSGLGGGYVNRTVGNSWGRSSTINTGHSSFSGSRSSIGGSVRGGFGSSGHGVSS